MNPALSMPLSTVRPGHTVVLRKVRAGQALTARLAAMGLLPGAKVHVYRNLKDGPMVLGINGSRVMLGRGMADKVSVQDDLS